MKNEDEIVMQIKKNKTKFKILNLKNFPTDSIQSKHKSERSCYEGLPTVSLYLKFTDLNTIT